jgi:hypothetical protein
VTMIGVKAFWFCMKLIDVTVFWDTPLRVKETFLYFPLSQATLHVPPGTEDLYRAAPVWGDFGEITSAPQ